MPLPVRTTQKDPLTKLVFANGASAYQSGTPFKTGALIATAKSQEQASEIPYFQLTRDEWGSKLTAPLGRSDRVFGLGEMLGGLDKRGKHYRLFAKDDASHSPDKAGLYGSHPFGIVYGERTFGFFLDFPGEIHIDAACKKRAELEVFIGSHDFSLIIIEGLTPLEIIRKYLELVGPPYLPPQWAFGFQQSRYSYPDRGAIEEIAKNFRTLKIPCDAVYFDIDYMKDYKCFTIDEQKFPGIKDLLADLRTHGIKAIPILDPGIKVEHGYDVYQSGLDGDHFCRTKDDLPFVGAVWPGLVCFPDFFNPKTQRWWAGWVDELMSLGFGGLWNDMNEPAIFYTPRGLERLREKVLLETETRDLGKEPVRFISSLGDFWHSEEYYREFYHRPGKGEPVQHLAVHNLYGTMMTNSSAQALKKEGAERYFLLSRSSYPGAHRNAVIWTGDNASWWEQLLTHIRMLLSLNMCGFFYSGADIGGFVHDASPELVTRWMELGVLTPLYRNHSTLGSRQQEPWAFDQEITEILRDVVTLRYALFPYIYSEFRRSVESLTPFAKPLFFDFPSERTLEIEDQFMAGSGLMAAPVIQANASGRYVHLPERSWLFWNASRHDERNCRVFAPGDYYIEAGLAQLPLFILENSVICLCEPGQWIGQKPITELTLIGLVSKEASFTYLEDDGGFLDRTTTGRGAIRVQIVRRDGRLFFDFDKEASTGYSMPTFKISAEIYDLNGSVERSEHEV